MKVMVLDTTRKNASIYIFDNDNCIDYNLKLDANLKHSESIFVYIEKALADNKLKISDFDYFGCVTGPGSFTGIRVGMSIIKAFNKVCNKKIVSINNFEILKSKIQDGYIILNSTIKTVYYAYIVDGKIKNAGVVDKDELLNLIDGKGVIELLDEQKSIGLEYNNIVTIDNITLDIKSILFDKIKNQDFENFKPYYLQLSQAERGVNDKI